MGRFVHRITDRIAKGIEVSINEQRCFVVPLFLELGDSPFVEEIRLTFRLGSTSPNDLNVLWLAPDSPHGEVEVVIHDSAEESDSSALLMFTFSAELSVADNFKELKRFVVANASDLLKAPRASGASRTPEPTAGDLLIAPRASGTPRTPESTR